MKTFQVFVGRLSEIRQQPDQAEMKGEWGVDKVSLSKTSEPKIHQLSYSQHFTTVSCRKPPHPGNTAAAAGYVDTRAYTSACLEQKMTLYSTIISTERDEPVGSVKNYENNEKMHVPIMPPCSYYAHKVECSNHSIINCYTTGR